MPTKLRLDIEKFIEQWNNKYPLDQIYRKRFGIAFGSPEHRALNLIDMCIELKEQLLIDRRMKQEAEQEENDFFNSGLPDDVTGTTGKPKTKIKKMSQKELDTEFENLDFTKYNDAQ